MRCLLEINPHEQFPELPDDFDVVFDLGGTISESSAQGKYDSKCQPDS